MEDVNKDTHEPSGSWRWWLCTWNNPPDNWLEYFTKFDKTTTYVVGQREVGKEGTPHIQFCLHSNKKPSAKQMQEWFPKSWHKGKSAAAAADLIKYCTKEETRIAGTSFSFGEKPRLSETTHGKYSEALELVREGKLMEVNPEILIKHLGNLYALGGMFTKPAGSEECRGVWIFGPAGTGKSTYAREQWPNHFLKESTKWWCSYMGEESVLLEDLDTSTLGHYLKIWADKWSFYGEVKGKPKVPTRHKVFVVTSNYTPAQLGNGGHGPRWDAEMVAAIQRRFMFIRTGKHVPMVHGTERGQIPSEYLDLNTELDGRLLNA